MQYPPSIFTTGGNIQYFRIFSDKWPDYLVHCENVISLLGFQDCYFPPKKLLWTKCVTYMDEFYCARSRGVTLAILF